MDIKGLNPREVYVLTILLSGSYRPQKIRDLEKRIKAKTRAIKLDTPTGIISYNLVKEIIEINLKLDRLYIDWVQKRLA